jgi:D-galactarolactone cycloisomerase
MDSKIARIELWHFSAPLPATFWPSWIPGFPQNHNRCTLVRVVDSDGAEGWSAGPAMARERRGLGDLLGPSLLGEDATDIATVQQRLREIGYFGWRNWWIEPAFWDIKGKRAGEPLWRLLGGDRREDIDLYASCGEVRSGAQRVADAEARYGEGFRTIKIRVHEDEEADIAQVTEVAKAVGDRMAIGVDANQAWRVSAIADAPRWDLARAKRFADACSDLGMAWIEEPLAMDAWDDQAALTAYSAVPIAGGELHTGGEPELRMMVERGCYSIYQPDAMFTGGVDQTVRIARFCQERGVIYTPHTWTNGIGFAVNLQLYGLAGGAKPLEYPYEPPGWVPEARDAMLEQPFLHDKGKLRIPDTPGLGFTVDRKALKKHGERFCVLDRKRLVLFGLRNQGLRAARQVDQAKRARMAAAAGSSHSSSE